MAGRFDKYSPMGGVGAGGVPPRPEDTTTLGPGVEGLMSMSRQAREWARTKMESVAEDIGKANPARNISPMQYQHNLDIPVGEITDILNPLPETVPDALLGVIPFAAVLKRSKEIVGPMAHVRRTYGGAPQAVSNEVDRRFDNIMMMLTRDANKAGLENMDQPQIADFLNNYVRRGIVDKDGNLHVGNPGELHHEIEQRLAHAGLLNPGLPKPNLDDVQQKDVGRLYRAYDEYLNAITESPVDFDYGTDDANRLITSISPQDQGAADRLTQIAEPIVRDIFGDENVDDVLDGLLQLPGHEFTPLSPEELFDEVYAHLQAVSGDLPQESYKFVVGPRQVVVGWEEGQNIEAGSNAILDVVYEQKHGVSRRTAGLRQTEYSDPFVSKSLPAVEDPRAVEREIRTAAGPAGGAATSGNIDITAADDVTERIRSLRHQSSKLVDEALALPPGDPRRDVLIDKANRFDVERGELAKRLVRGGK